MSENRAIGIYDSGVGGLTVLSQLIDFFPNEDFIYVADQANAPFGSKSKEELKIINDNILDFLISKNIKLLIIACNTSCALFLSYISNKVDIPVIDLITPISQKIGIKERRLAVLATEQTIKSSIYKTVIKNYYPNCNVLEVACPDLVPIVEKQLLNSKKDYEKSYKYIDQAIQFKAEGIIYGCSHYPYFQDIWSKYIGNNIRLYDPAKYIIDEVDLLLKNDQMLVTKKCTGKVSFYVSKERDRFQEFIKKTLSPINYIIKEFKHLKQTVY